ncbi:MAG: UPF0149 family protein [bacterium]|nr:UPF0149 family protein [bacterium]
MQQDDIDHSFSAPEMQKIGAFLDASTDAMGFDETLGLIAGICSAPTMIMPSTWLSVVLGEHVFESVQEAQEINTLFLRFHNQVNDSLLNEQRTIPPASLDDEQLADWCGGYLEAVGMDDVWRQDKNTLPTLLPIGILSGEVPITGLKGHDGKIIEDDSEYRAQARESLPERIADLHQYWTEWRCQQMASQKPITQSKPQRNGPCPCGSGAKYKKCCGR